MSESVLADKEVVIASAELHCFGGRVVECLVAYLAERTGQDDFLEWRILEGLCLDADYLVLLAIVFQRIGNHHFQTFEAVVIILFRIVMISCHRSGHLVVVYPIP